MPIPAGAPSGLVSIDEFKLYLNNQSLDVDRANLILGLAQTLCESIVNPLPAGSDIVILDVAERAFSNPTNVGGSIALYSEGEGPFNSSTPGTTSGGLWLTENNKRTLRTLAGKGGAFTIDTLSTSYTPSLPWWDAGASVPGNAGDWDTPA